ncbi:MAG: DoxX family membrane protein [Fimbriimonadaceae bacterium]|jgi:putative oxidoreductase|nr:DoxX family membrane protein [Fimbriimonadaceae bacterium]
MLNLLKPIDLSAKASTGLLLLRLLAGSAMVLHGLPKLGNPTGWMPAEVGIPGFLLALVVLGEVAGGLGLLLGALSPLACLGVAAAMGGAIWFKIQNGAAFVNQSEGYSYPALFLAVAVALIFTGPGRFSLDALVFGKANAPSSDPALQ